MPRRLSFDPIEEARRQWIVHDLPEPLAMAGTTSIMRANQIVQARVDEALRPFGLTFARYEALTLLSFTKAGRLPMAKIGDRLMIHPASVTHTIDRLERDGLVRREPDPRDRRSRLAVLTPAGRKLARKAAKAVGDAQFGLPLEPRLAEQLVAILRELRLAVGDFSDGPSVAARTSRGRGAGSGRRHTERPPDAR